MKPWTQGSVILLFATLMDARSSLHSFKKSHCFSRAVSGFLNNLVVPKFPELKKSNKLSTLSRNSSVCTASDGMPPSATTAHECIFPQRLSDWAPALLGAHAYLQKGRDNVSPRKFWCQFNRLAVVSLEKVRNVLPFHRLFANRHHVLANYFEVNLTNVVDHKSSKYENR